MDKPEVLSNFEAIIDFVKSQTEEIEDETDEDLKNLENDDLKKANNDDDDDDEEKDTKKKKKKNKDDDDMNDDDYEKSQSDFEDASPILKAVSDNIDYNNKRIDTLIETTEKLIKAMGENQISNEEILKSTKEEVDKIGSEKLETPGIWDAEQLLKSNAVLVKSIGGQKELDMPMEKQFVKATLLAGVKNNLIKSENVTKFELAKPGMEMATLDPEALSYLRRSLSNTNQGAM